MSDPPSESGGDAPVRVRREPDCEQMKAVAQVQRWHDFKAHVGAYLLINAVLIVVWAATGGGAFWPGISLAAWGLGLSSQHFLNSFSPITADRVRRELGRRRDK